VGSGLTDDVWQVIDAREGVAHQPDDGAIAQTDDRVDADRVQQVSRLAVRTGVLPRWVTCFGPPTELAGFVETTCPMTSQSNSILTAARCCFTVGADRVE
jgi:hypothetical protein